MAYVSGIMMSSPVVVGLDYTVQPCRWITQFIDSYHHWITSLRSAVFPASGFCKNAYAMTSTFDVVLGGILREGTEGVEPSNVRPNMSRELL